MKCLKRLGALLLAAVLTLGLWQVPGMTAVQEWDWKRLSLQ